MNDESFEQIERQIVSLQPITSSDALRSAVLAGVNRELRAARWDRRWERFAAAALLLGVGLNGAIGLQVSRIGPQRVATSASREALVQTAMSVAEVTDAQTARMFAQQLAALTGWSLSSDDTAAIDAAVDRTTRPVAARENKG